MNCIRRFWRWWTAWRECPECNGERRVIAWQSANEWESITCPVCHGKGRVKEGKA